MQPPGGSPQPTGLEAQGTRAQEGPAHALSVLTFPHGLGQDGSPGFEAFHSAKSLGDRFSLRRSAETLRSPARTGVGQRGLDAIAARPSDCLLCRGQARLWALCPGAGGLHVQAGKVLVMSSFVLLLASDGSGLREATWPAARGGPGALACEAGPG